MHAEERRPEVGLQPCRTLGACRAGRDAGSVRSGRRRGSGARSSRPTSRAASRSPSVDLLGREGQAGDVALEVAVLVEARLSARSARSPRRRSGGRRIARGGSRRSPCACPRRRRRRGCSRPRAASSCCEREQVVEREHARLPGAAAPPASSPSRGAGAAPTAGQRPRRRRRARRPRRREEPAASASARADAARIARGMHARRRRRGRPRGRRYGSRTRIRAGGRACRAARSASARARHRAGVLGARARRWAGRSCVVGDWRPVAQRLTALHWVLLVAGHAVLRAGARRPRAALRLAGARDAPQPAPAGVPRRRHPRDEDAARVAAALPRDARPPRSRRPSGAAPFLGAHAARTSSGSSAPSSRCSRRRAPRRGARAPRRAASTLRALLARVRRARCATRHGLLRRGACGSSRRPPPSRRRRARARRWCSATCSRTPCKYSDGAGRRARARVRAARDGRVRVEIADRGIGHPARASCAGSSSASTGRAATCSARRQGLGPRPVHRAQPGAPPGRPRGGAQRGPGPRQPLRRDAARRARAAASRRAAEPRRRSRRRERVAMSARSSSSRTKRTSPRGSRFNLEAEGTRWRWRADGRARRGARSAREPPLDLVILDVMLPGDERLRGRAPRARRGQLRADPDPHREGRRARRRARHRGGRGRLPDQALHARRAARARARAAAPAALGRRRADDAAPARSERVGARDRPLRPLRARDARRARCGSRRARSACCARSSTARARPSTRGELLERSGGCAPRRARAWWTASSCACAATSSGSGAAAPHRLGARPRLSLSVAMSARDL